MYVNHMPNSSGEKKQVESNFPQEALGHKKENLAKGRRTNKRSEEVLLLINSFSHSDNKESNLSEAAEPKDKLLSDKHLRTWDSISNRIDIERKMN